MSYKEYKERLRSEAITWQHIFNTVAMSMQDIAWDNWYFTKQGKRYGLLKEFKENGII